VKRSARFIGITAKGLILPLFSSVDIFSTRDENEVTKCVFLTLYQSTFFSSKFVCNVNFVLQVASR